MKLFSVTISVQVALIGPVVEVEPQPRIADGLPDDPVKASGEMLQRFFELQNKTSPVFVPGRYPPNGAGQGLTLNEEVQVQARDFSEVQKIIARFHDVALGLTPEGQFELEERRTK